MVIRKKFIIAGAVAVVVLAVAAGVLMKSGNSGQGRGGMGGQSQDVSVVRAAYPTRGDLSLTVSLTGTVESDDVVYSYAKASGDVTAVHAKAGDVVEAGEVLLEIDTEQVEDAKNSMDSAEVNMNEAQSTLTRMKILYDGGDLSAQDYEQYQNQARSAQLSYESAELNYIRQLEYSSVKAPISGTIESFDVEVYDRVATNDQLFVIAGDGENRITFYVTQRMVNNLQVGDAIEVVKNSTSYEGWISEISTMVDDSNGLFKIKANMENTGEIATGSVVKLNVATEHTEDAMLVPVDAIYYSNSEAYVYTESDGYAHMTYVEVGLYDDEYAEILSGLSEDDVVVSTWSSNLYEGAEIRVRMDGETGTTDTSEAAGAGENAGSGDASADARQ